MWEEVTDSDDRMAQTEKSPYALISQEHLVAIVRAMPDAKSAVLLCLAWSATRQSRLHRGEHAGQPVARLSANELADLTGRAVRTVRYALSNLKQAAIISIDQGGSGKKNVYRLSLTLGGERDK